MDGVTSPTVEDLQERLDQLALAVLDGKPGAREAYAATLAEVARLRSEQDLKARAEKQRALREAGERQAQGEARRRELEGQLAEQFRQRPELARAVDGAADGFVAAIERLRAHGEAMYRVTLKLGQNRPRLRLDEAVSEYVRWRLSPFVHTLGRPDRPYRRPLAEIAGGDGGRD